MKNPSYHNFAQVPSVQIPRSAFDMSSRYKTAFDSGKLVPVHAPIEILPGDSIDMSIQAFARLSTPVVPFMDNITLRYFTFFVPNRLVDDNWVKQMGEQKNPGDSIDYLTPQVVAPAKGFEIGSPADYFGLPTGVGGISVNALPFRAMNLIWNEFFRPELLADSLQVPTGDGPDNYSLYSSLRPYFNRLDYFQGCHPSPQKGPGVELPIGQYAPVVTRPNVADGTASDTTLKWSRLDGTAYTGGQYTYLNITDQNRTQAQTLPGQLPGTANEIKPRNLWTDLSSATMVTINSLRQAFQVQMFLEREMLAGSRYTEICRSMFGVINPDARLQRPEFLGGGTIPLMVSSVPQTSATNDTSPQGNLAAFGVAKAHLPHIRKSFTEHGFILTFAVAISPITYQQGIDRFWSRRTRFDYYWPVFAHLGEQAVLNKEIYAQGTLKDDEAFGYQERWAEYRYGISHITGKLRSTAPQPLDYWHLGIKYNSLPKLGKDFATVKVPLERVLAVQDEPQFVYDSFIRCRMIRPMPVYSTPGRIDHWA